jgi:mandelate racemase
VGIAEITLSATSPALTLRCVRTTAVEVRLRFVLGTSAAVVRAEPPLLVDAESQQGVTGRACIFCCRQSAAQGIADLPQVTAATIRGQAIADPLERRFALLGVTDIARMALSVLDIALQDALAVAAGMLLATLLGSTTHPLGEYNSCGRRRRRERRPVQLAPGARNERTGTRRVADLPLTRVRRLGRPAAA